MKKIFAIALAVAMLASMATVVSAAESSTTLTTSVPEATYTLNIPALVEVPFGTTELEIGEIYISESANFAEGKNVSVTIGFTPFSAENVSTTIPFGGYLLCTSVTNETYKKQITNSANTFVFKGTSKGTVTKYIQGSFPGAGAATGTITKSLDTLFITMNSSSWAKALAGEYTGYITFTTEVVVE